MCNSKGRECKSDWIDFVFVSGSCMPCSIILNINLFLVVNPMFFLSS